MEKAPRVVLLDAATFGDASLAPLRQWPCEIYPFSPAETVLSRLAGQEVAVVNKVVLDGATLKSAEARALKLIAVAATGVDNIDLKAAQELGIGVANVPGYATDAVAQFTIALILEFATRAGSYIALVRRGAWEKSPVFTVLDYPAVELAGKTLGIVGYGRIGQKVATMARALGLNVLVAQRIGSDRPLADRVELEELLARSDFISLHCPLTAETRNLINRRTLALVKPGAFLINTARGALIDDAALLAALKSRRLGGAALDVLTREPPPADHPLIAAAKSLDNLLVTPHCAWGTREARERLIGEVAQNIAAYARGERRNRVV
ncbi:MAG TPA: D-2-hydroxyacid dehydrogenase [Candidatus Acidoferrales bacterium]|nr:D-2-hydroxyacid dehydrogenase [Candidatus Acidoferrales bacterium]